LRRYCADTSSIVAAWVERYPPEFFPRLWDQLADLIKAGRIFAPDEVRNELLKRSSDAVDWLDAFSGFFVPTDTVVINTVSAILKRHPKLVMAHKTAYAADPFVIALAQTSRAHVLTEEGIGSAGKPKIPLVCQGYGVDHCNLLDMIKHERLVSG
jgi:hypothetical protein